MQAVEQTDREPERRVIALGPQPKAENGNQRQENARSPQRLGQHAHPKPLKDFAHRRAHERQAHQDERPVFLQVAAKEFRHAQTQMHERHDEEQFGSENVPGPLLLRQTQRVKVRDQCQGQGGGDQEAQGQKNGDSQ